MVGPFRPIPGDTANPPQARGRNHREPATRDRRDISDRIVVSLPGLACHLRGAASMILPRLFSHHPITNRRARGRIASTHSRQG